MKHGATSKHYTIGTIGYGWAATKAVLDDTFHSMRLKADKGADMPLTSFTEAKKTFDVIFAADKSAAQGGVPVIL
jgi:hypothetical protein